jgi:hypothetical protein
VPVRTCIRPRQLQAEQSEAKQSKACEWKTGGRPADQVEEWKGVSEVRESDGACMMNGMHAYAWQRGLEVEDQRWTRSGSAGAAGIIVIGDILCLASTVQQACGARVPDHM